EVRVPFIDHRLAEKLIALPGEWKMDPTTPKPLLVEALRGALPDEIVHRQKRGFTLPFEHWLRDDLKVEAEKTLGRIKDGPMGCILQDSAVQEIWSDFLAGRTSWSRRWSLFVLQQWCERHSLEV